MPKNVQIPYNLFLLLCKYHLIEPDANMEAAIIAGLTDKLDSLTKHELYSRYKDNKLSEEERQTARKEYLDRVGMQEGFRWSSLEPPK